MLNIYDPSFVKKLFNQMSSSYERMNYVTSLGFSYIWRKQFIHLLESNDKQIKVLDLLSGLGENWKLLIKKFPNAEFFGLDFSEKMIASSNNKNEKELDNRFSVLQRDILLDDHALENFDIVSCAFGLKTFNKEQINQVAKTLFHSLKNGGTFSFIEISVPPNKILRFFYKLYLSRIIPVLGRLFLANPSDYRMLWIYTENFENCKEAKLIFEKNQLKVTFKSYFFSCATGLVGYK